MLPHCNIALVVLKGLVSNRCLNYTQKVVVGEMRFCGSDYDSQVDTSCLVVFPFTDNPPNNIYSGISLKRTWSKADTSIYNGYSIFGTKQTDFRSNSHKEILFKADTSIRQTVFSAPMVSALERFHFTMILSRYRHSSCLYTDSYSLKASTLCNF